jgi:hypothetical protein
MPPEIIWISDVIVAYGKRYEGTRWTYQTVHTSEKTTKDHEKRCKSTSILEQLSSIDYRGSSIMNRLTDYSDLKSPTQISW